MTGTSELTTASFDLSQLRAPRRYVWREIERDEQDPLKVKLLRLTMQEVGELVFGPTTPMKDVHASIAPYVVEWDFKAENLLTGEMVDVPPPAEIGGEVFEIMEGPIGTMIVLWLKSPQFMERGDDEKKDSSSSEPTEPPSSESD